MDVHFLKNPIGGCGYFNSLGDTLLIPIHVLTGAQGYYVSHNQIFSVATKVEGVVARCFALLVLLAFIPVVAAGLLCKAVAYLLGANEAYEKVRQTAAGLFLSYDGLSRTPAVVEPQLSTETEIAQLYSLDRLLVIWDEVGKNRGDYQGYRTALQEWIGKIPDGSTYNYIVKSELDNAVQQLQTELRLILQEFDQPKWTDEKKEGVLIRLIDASRVCSPTWLEVTHAEYTSLVEGELTDVVLRIVQDFKENNLLQIVQVGKDSTQWHLINSFRSSYGHEFGLRMDVVKKDKVAGRFNQSISPEEFLATYTEAALLDYVESQLNLDNRGEQIAQFLSQASQRENPGQDEGACLSEVQSTCFHPLELFESRKKSSPEAVELLDQYRAAVVELEKAEPAKRLVQAALPAGTVKEYELYDVEGKEQYKTQHAQERPLLELYDIACRNPKKILKIYQLASEEAKQQLVVSAGAATQAFFKAYKADHLYQISCSQEEAQAFKTFGEKVLGKQHPEFAERIRKFRAEAQSKRTDLCHLVELYEKSDTSLQAALDSQKEVLEDLRTKTKVSNKTGARVPFEEDDQEFRETQIQFTEVGLRNKINQEGVKRLLTEIGLMRQIG